MQQTLQQAIELHRAGRLADAEPIYRRLLPLEPRNPQLLHVLGMLLTQTGRAAEALPHLRSAAALAPQASMVQFALAQAARSAGQMAEAQAAAQRAISLRSDFAPAHNELGLALVNQGKIADAVPAWRRATELNPKFADAWSNLGAALAQVKQPREAIAALRRSIELMPDSPAAHNNLAGALDEANCTEDAIYHWRRAIELKPVFFDALQNLAKVIHQRGDDTEALSLINRAVEANPADPHARFLRGLIHLGRGNLREGFAEYEFRKQSTHFDIKGRSFPQPLWDGGDVAGKRILLHAEQGLGDFIQFVRYAPLLAERGADVIVESPFELVDLVRTLPRVREVAVRGETLPEFDIHASVVSLPALFGTTLETIPTNVPYLSAAPDRVARWKEILGEANGKRRIGLVHAGNPSHTNDSQRSIAPREFAVLAQTPDVIWFSLQKRRNSSADPWADSGLTVIDHTESLHDFAETAAFISQLDLVITVDTAVAHVAGALGKPVWTLIAYVPDWRWMKDRADSPWYPSMRLFRQPSLGDWANVLREVASALDEAARKS